MWQELLFSLVLRFAPVLFGHAVAAVGRMLDELPAERRDEYGENVALWVKAIYQRYPDMPGEERRARVVEAVKQIERDWGLVVSDSTRDTAIQNAAKAFRP